MKRRNFFGILFGLAVTPSVIVKVLTAAPSGLVVKSLSITSGKRKLKATWSVEAEQDLQHFHNIDMSTELLSVL